MSIRNPKTADPGSRGKTKNPQSCQQDRQKTTLQDAKKPRTCRLPAFEAHGERPGFWKKMKPQVVHLDTMGADDKPVQEMIDFRRILVIRAFSASSGVKRRFWLYKLGEENPWARNRYSSSLRGRQDNGSALRHGIVISRSSMSGWHISWQRHLQIHSNRPTTGQRSPCLWPLCGRWYERILHSSICEKVSHLLK